MNDEQNSAPNNTSIRRCSIILISIFNIVVFICGMVLFTINCFFMTASSYSPIATYIAVIMLIVPTLYYLGLLIKTAKQK